MTPLLELTLPIGDGLNNDPEDVAKLRETLLTIGAADDEDLPDPGTFTDNLARSIKRFQDGRGLRIDGALLPGGETEQAINNILAGKPAGAALFGHPPLKIEGGVGDGRKNGTSDVRSVKQALGALGYLPEHPSEEPHGYIDAATVAAIENFQADNDLRTDGWLGPKGETIGRLHAATEAHKAAIEPAYARYSDATARTGDVEPEEAVRSVQAPVSPKLARVITPGLRPAPGIGPQLRYAPRQAPRTPPRQQRPPRAPIPRPDRKGSDQKQSPQPQMPPVELPGGPNPDRYARDGFQGIRDKDDFVDVTGLDPSLPVDRLVITLDRRGNALTQRQLRDILDHILNEALRDHRCTVLHRGGSKKSEHGTRTSRHKFHDENEKETWLRPRDKKRRSDGTEDNRTGGSYADLTLQSESDRRLFINTYDRKAYTISPTKRERDAAARLVYNANKGDFLLMIPKLRPNETLDPKRFDEILRRLLDEICDKQKDQYDAPPADREPIYLEDDVI